MAMGSAGDLIFIIEEASCMNHCIVNVSLLVRAMIQHIKAPDYILNL